MLIPKRTKYRKPHRLTYDGHARGNTTLSFGTYGLMATEGGWVSSKQIEAARIAMTRYMKRGGKVWINIFPHLALTKKPLETRQGKVMFEIAEVDEAIAREAFRLASHKLCVKTKFVKKEESGEEK